MVRVVVQQHHGHPGGLDGPQQRGEQQRVAAMQVDVAVPVADVELHRQPQVHAAPDQEPLQRLVSQPRRTRPVKLGFRQPAPRCRRDLGVRRPFGPKIETGPVRGDRLDPDRRCGPGGQRGPDRVGEPVRAHPRRHHVLGHPLQPDDLVRGRAGQVAELGRGGNRLRDVAGVHAQHRRPGGQQEPLAHLGGAQFGPPGHVVAQFGVRRQAEDRRAEAAEHEPGLRVEHRAAGPARAFGQHRLQRGHVGVAAQHPVAVVVDEGLLGDVGKQVRH